MTNDRTHWLRNQVCSACGTSVRAAARWCVRCGEPLWADDAAPQRRRPLNLKSIANGVTPTVFEIPPPLRDQRFFAWGACGADVWLSAATGDGAKTAAYYSVQLQAGRFEVTRMGADRNERFPEGPHLGSLVETPIATRHGLFLATAREVVIFAGHGARGVRVPRDDGAVVPTMLRRVWTAPENYSICGATPMPNGKVLLAVARPEGAVHLLAGTGQGGMFQLVATVPFAAPRKGMGVDLIAGVNQDGRDVVGLLSRGRLHVLDLDAGEQTSEDQAVSERPLLFSERFDASPGPARSPRTVRPDGRAAMTVAVKGGWAVLWTGFRAHTGRDVGLSVFPNRSDSAPVSVWIDDDASMTAWTDEFGGLLGLDVASRQLKWQDGQGIAPTRVPLPPPVTLEGQIVHLHHAGPAAGWQLEVQAPPVREPKAVRALQIFGLETEPCPRFMPPLAVEDFGLLVAINQGGRFSSILGFRDA
jgi:hypothetical protein